MAAARCSAARRRRGVGPDNAELPVAPRRYLPAVGITRFATRIRLSTRTDPAGLTVWVVDYTVSQHGRESRFVTHHVAEAAARRMVANLLADRLPGLSVEEVYAEELG